MFTYSHHLFIHSFIRMFVHSFNKHLLDAVCSVPGSIDGLSHVLAEPIALSA